MKKKNKKFFQKGETKFKMKLALENERNYESTIYENQNMGILPHLKCSHLALSFIFNELRNY